MTRTTHLSRREFAAIVAGAAVAGATTAAGYPLRSQAPALSIGDVIDRIRNSIGVEWRPDTVDTLKAGDASARVTGVVTTSLATLTVLRQAVDDGANLILTSQPAFYSRGDARTPPAGRGGRGAAAPPPPPPPDPVFTAKNDFINRHGLAIFRLHDHWRLREPNPHAVALARALGPGVQPAAGTSHYDIAEVTLEALARDVKTALDLRGGIRVIGNRQTRVRTLALLPGATPIASSVAVLPDVDVIVAGEVREWESTEYVRDVVHAGGRKGLILVGRVVSEEAGMAECARWLAPLLPGIPVKHVAAGDPYWRPA